MVLPASTVIVKLMDPTGASDDVTILEGSGCTDGLGCVVGIRLAVGDAGSPGAVLVPAEAAAAWYGDPDRRTRTKTSATLVTTVSPSALIPCTAGLT